MVNVNYEYSNMNIDDLKTVESELKGIIEVFNKKECLGNDFIGWAEYPCSIKGELISKIKEDAIKIKKNSNVLVVCGIGGSYLGARAVIEAIKGFCLKGFEIIYLGNTFDEEYTKDTLAYLKNKDFCVNIISKSGSTLETAFAFRLLKKLLKEKYGEKARERIYVTTDEKKGCLREMVKKEGYTSYVIPEDIGGRYSVFTPVGLLPIAVAGINIEEFIKGAQEAADDVKNNNFECNIALQYAAYRYLQYKQGKNVELFATYSPYLNMFSEWWKQLFGESEGKNNKGLFPASVSFSTDLHSLGQFIQEGSKVLFITQIKTRQKGNLYIDLDESDIDGLNYLKDKTLGQINLIAQEGTNKAHFKEAGVDNFTFEVEKINERNIGYLLFTMMYSCMLSANLLGVNPFNQPGVEFYKKEMKKMLKK